jgi:hypothetical protein
MIRRREFLIAAGAAAIASPAVVRADQPTAIKMGALKLIHSIAPYFYERFTPAGYKVDIIPFESPAARTPWSPSRSTSACSGSRRRHSARRRASRSS